MDYYEKILLFAGFGEMFQGAKQAIKHKIPNT
jgi:hypothetical protein